jgi:Adenylate and Guanylate cyclase catalytic domain
VSIRIYPSQKFMDSHGSYISTFMTIIVVAVFLFTTMMFLVYDRLVERRQALFLHRAIQSSAIVSSLFPHNVVERLMLPAKPEGSLSTSVQYSSNSQRLKHFLVGRNYDGADAGIQPVADLFPFATELFADIAGFTAWCSTRDPSLVFLLLQNIYSAFDILAKRRCVFKVETIGDSYLAVTGVPDPQEQYVVIMARFAFDCQLSLVTVTESLSRVLGPGTTNLRMRIGIHSGPVTTGFLVGDRARYCEYCLTIAFARIYYWPSDYDPYFTHNSSSIGDSRKRTLGTQSRRLGKCQGERNNEYILAMPTSNLYGK